MKYFATSKATAVEIRRMKNTVTSVFIVIVPQLSLPRYVSVEN